MAQIIQTTNETDTSTYNANDLIQSIKIHIEQNTKYYCEITNKHRPKSGLYDVLNIYPINKSKRYLRRIENDIIITKSLLATIEINPINPQEIFLSLYDKHMKGTTIYNLTDPNSFSIEKIIQNINSLHNWRSHELYRSNPPINQNPPRTNNQI